MQGWLEQHPGWEHHLWTDKSRPSLVNEEVFRASPYPAQRADILRYEVVFMHGGVYLDMDMECQRSIEPLVDGVEAFVGEEETDRLAVGIFGASPRHPWLRTLIDEVPNSWREQPTIPDQTGPGFVTRVSKGRADLTVFPPSFFYPYSWREPELASAVFPEAYAVHRWQHSWAADEEAEHERRFGSLSEAAQEIEKFAERGMTILLFESGEELELDQSRRVICFSRREDFWGNPASSAEAIAEFKTLAEAGADWAVFLDSTFWWFDYYREFIDFVASRSSGMESGRRFRAFRVS